jgi:hypothetical protein
VADEAASQITAQAAPKEGHRGRCELDDGPADGGETKLSNLVSLCRFHHRAVHEGGLTVERRHDGAWRFVKPDGKSIEGCAPGHTLPFSD